jgi:hypothetical protein
MEEKNSDEKWKGKNYLDPIYFDKQNLHEQDDRGHTLFFFLIFLFSSLSSIPHSPCLCLSLTFLTTNCHGLLH